MKRKFGNRQGWGRIGHQQYTQHYLNNDIFKGYVCLICFDKVLHPLWSSYTKKKICLVEDGSYMLQQYPEGKHYSMISYFSPEGTLLQWYIDITYSTGVEDGIPYMDDLYLDLIVVPDGEVIEKDLDELEQALSEGEITNAQYHLAWLAFHEVKEAISTNSFPLFELSKEHFQQLKKGLPNR